MSAELPRTPFPFLMTYVRRHSWRYGILMTAITLAVLCSVSTQYGLKYLIDVVATPASDEALRQAWQALFILAGLIVADIILWRGGGYLAAGSLTLSAGCIRNDLFAHLSQHSPAYFADRLPGALSARISSSAISAQTIGNTVAWNVVPPAMSAFTALLFISLVDGWLALVLFACALAIAVVLHLLARKKSHLHETHAGHVAALDGEIVDIVGNIGVVRSFGAGRRERGRIAELSRVEVQAHRRSLYSMEHLRFLHAGLTVVLTIGVMIAGIRLWHAGRATTGDVALLATLSLTILNATRDLAIALVEVAQQRARLAEALKVILVPHAMTDAAHARPARRGCGEIRIEDVSFSYDGRRPVLRHINLVIPPGQKVGLVGRSGSGKSTLFALLQRVHDPGAGRILLDGQDLRHVTQESLATAMAVVPQDTSLFNRTIRENMSYGTPDLAFEELVAAAAKTRCEEVVEALPARYDTMVGNRGVKLSGGQRQRIAIARALLTPTPILLLDEATSALDSENEHAIAEALKEALHRRTVVAVAHRLSTLQNFDRIIVLDEGRIVEDGSPAELVRRQGPYLALLRQQRAGLSPVRPEAA
ncbi:ABC transporter ATP-binding protein [Pseudoroseomonas globiformis]|uniref:ABC transporter ATP-binding protein n=1 Tax=Teichococcus globiformis TaxID=2307229 RepID=A0ABV7FZR1_9PROT